MVLLVSPPATDFNFESTCSSPYISAPSSPRGFGDFFFSAPTSPTRASKIYREFNLSFGTNAPSSSSVIPFDWEEKPGTPKSNYSHVIGDNDDFEFEFSGPLERPSLSAEDLFDGGKIKPLKPPPRVHVEASPLSSPKSPSPLKKAFSPRKKKDSDPFTASIVQTRRDAKQERGREKNNIYSSSNSSRRGSRSLSPLRVSQFPWEEQQQQEQQQQPEKSTKDSNSSSKQSSKGYRKWRLKDFLLFRSASEGRATDKDPLRKYAALSKKSDDVKNASFRSIDSSGSVSGSSRRKGRVSAHELHYTANRAVSEELKKKTFLPYKRGLLGCLAFNPTANGLAKGLSSVNR